MNQCEKMSIPFVTSLPHASESISNSYNLVVDALFGFSFKGEIRPPFDDVLEKLKGVTIPICSIDIPSGLK